MTQPEKEDVKITEKLLVEASGEHNLTKIVSLNFHNRGLSKIELLDLCPRLRTLDLSFNKLARVEGLEGNPELRELKLYNNQLDRFNGLNKLGKLEVLHIRNNSIWNFKGLETNRNLKQLYAANNRIASLDGVGKLINLTALDVSNNELRTIEGIHTLQVLEELNLSGNEIRGFEGLDQLGQLRELALCDNHLPSLKGLPRLRHLDILRLDGNQIKSLSGLSKGFKNITELYLARNGLKSLAGLGESCRALQILDAGENRLESASDAFQALQQVAELVEVRLEGNPFAEAAGENYRFDVCTALPRVEYVDEHPVTPADRQARNFITSGASAGPPEDADTEAGEFDPSKSEMAEYMQKMGISMMVNPQLGRPSSRSGRGFDLQSADEAEPMRASLSLQGSRPQTPLMYSRPPSERTARGTRLPDADEYEACAADFKEEMQAYRRDMSSVIGKIRAGLQADPKELMQRIREKRPQTPLEVPVPPVMRTPRMAEPASDRRRAKEQQNFLKSNNGPLPPAAMGMDPSAGPAVGDPPASPSPSRAAGTTGAAPGTAPERPSVHPGAALQAAKDKKGKLNINGISIDMDGARNALDMYSRLFPAGQEASPADPPQPPRAASSAFPSSSESSSAAAAAAPVPESPRGPRKPDPKNLLPEEDDDDDDLSQYGEGGALPARGAGLRAAAVNPHGLSEQQRAGYQKFRPRSAGKRPSFLPGAPDGGARAQAALIPQSPRPTTPRPTSSHADRKENNGARAGGSAAPKAAPKKGLLAQGRPLHR